MLFAVEPSLSRSLSRSGPPIYPSPSPACIHRVICPTLSRSSASRSRIRTHRCALVAFSRFSLYHTHTHTHTHTRVRACVASVSVSRCARASIQRASRECHAYLFCICATDAREAPNLGLPGDARTWSFFIPSVRRRSLHPNSPAGLSCYTVPQEFQGTAGSPTPTQIRYRCARQRSPR